jgi:hypothetical protein
MSHPAAMETVSDRRQCRLLISARPSAQPRVAAPAAEIHVFVDARQKRVGIAFKRPLPQRLGDELYRFATSALKLQGPLVLRAFHPAASFLT